MYKITNIIFSIIIILFFLTIFNYYSSNKNIKKINLNRSNFNYNLKGKILNLPILSNNTKNVIEFNSSFSNEIKSNESRNFWDLLKSK